MWPFSSNKPIGEAFGNIRIGAVLGANDKQFIKDLKKILPALTSKEGKAVLKFMKNLGEERMQESFMMVAVDRETYHKAARRNLPKLKYLVYTAGSSRDCCHESWGQGCCSGPDLEDATDLENSYYIMEYTGNKEFGS